MVKGITFGQLNGGGKRVGIVATMWNRVLVDRLVEECVRGLKDAGVEGDAVVIERVPGAFELPRGAKMLIDGGLVDAVVCIGVLVKGETMHFEYISDAVSRGIMGLNLQTDIPVIYGVLNCLSEEQVGARIKHGYEWGMSAVHMALISINRSTNQLI